MSEVYDTLPPDMNVNWGAAFPVYEVHLGGGQPIRVAVPRGTSFLVVQAFVEAGARFLWEDFDWSLAGGQPPERITVARYDQSRGPLFGFGPRPLTIDSIEPDTGPPVDHVMIRGNRVGLAGNTGGTVTFGGVQATREYQGQNILSAQPPFGPGPGPVDVTVTLPDGESATRLNGFTYVGAAA